MIRYEIYQIMRKYGGASVNNETKEKQLAEIDQVFLRKPKFREDAMELYGVRRVNGDKRDIEKLMKEVYLDYYTYSI